MDILQYTTPQELDTYSQWQTLQTCNNLWQSLAWKTYQEALGREVRIYVAKDDDHIVASALVVIDRTIGGLSVWDIPRGPVGDAQKTKSLLEYIVADAQKNNCMQIFISPYIEIPYSIFHIPYSNARHQQPEATRIINLTQSDDDILAQMKQKGRYNIKLAQKRGVTVEQSNDVDAYYALAQETGKRDGFTGLSQATYQTFLDQIPGSFLLLAHNTKKTPIAGLIGVIHDDYGIYYYGASSYAHRASMAPYLLQWEAMQLCKAQGCVSYDLLGTAPSESNDTHPWKGITSFKEKFGGEEVLYPPEQMIVLKPLAAKMIGWKRRLLG